MYWERYLQDIYVFFIQVNVDNLGLNYFRSEKWFVVIFSKLTIFIGKKNIP